MKETTYADIIAELTDAPEYEDATLEEIINAGL